MRTLLSSRIKSTENTFLLSAVICFLLIPHHIPAQHTNVLISDFFSPNETSICINPKNTQQMVAGANLAQVLYSQDGGETWTQSSVSCPWGIWGDPMIGVDTTGAFYYLHLSNPSDGNWIDRIIAQKSVDGGITWSDGSYMGLNGTKAQDKHWMAVDRKTNHLYVTWTQFDHYGSSAPSDSSVILFSRSIDAGETWTPAVRISQRAGDCIDSDDTAEGAVPAVGPNGEVFVGWANRDSLWFDRSTDGGLTWLDEDIFVSRQISGWDFDISGIYRANGLPVTDCDLSGGPHHGTVYINFADRSNDGNDMDVWLVKSTDGGDTWTNPVRVNDDGSGRDQFFTWMTVDQVTGWLWFVFYDRRDYADNRTDVFMAVSRDGGASFENFKVSESPFTPSSGYFFGDYTGISAHNNVVRPVWTRLDNSDLSIWTALVQTDSLVSTTQPEEDYAFLVGNPYPNPFTEETGISFKLRRRSLVNLSIMDLQGRIVAQLIEMEFRDYGVYLEKIEFQDSGLANGMYFAVLSINGVLTQRKLIHTY